MCRFHIENECMFRKFARVKIFKLVVFQNTSDNQEIYF